MKRVLMIADDLTGANANCSLMKKIGLRAASFLGTNISQIPKNIDVVAATTDSRAMTSKQSYKEVAKKVKLFKEEDIILYSKRIDSTLRGNLGAELQAYQDSLAEKRVAIAVPAYPNSGRIVINGTMYVNGNLLVNTDAGKDPKMPVISSKVIDNFKKSYKGRIKEVFIEDIEKGLEHLINLIKSYSKDFDLIIFDTISNSHISLIAKAVSKSEIKYISVDPGPFSTELTSLLYKRLHIQTKALAVIGSVTQITIDQLKELKKNYKHYEVKVDPIKLMNMGTIQDEISRALKLIKGNIEKVDLAILTTTPENLEDRLNLIEISKETGISVDDLSLIISRGLANIAKQILEDNETFSGIFSSGGDITVALAEELLSTGIEIKQEVVPLAAYGRVIGGLRPGLKIVSKGGMVGDEKTMVKCVETILKLED